ncbi:MAG TPA: DUF6152 family protein [Pseudomonadales bacterium]
MHYVIRSMAAALLAAGASLAYAHHSFAVHFEADANKEVSGVVDRFQFANPHGMLFFTVTDANGVKAQWRAETNSPNLLRRRGWSKDSLKAGDEITVLGFPARDGTNYMRISTITFADGRELVGQGSAPPAQGEAD